MDKRELKQLRASLKKTQKQMAQLLGVSLKAIHSYEQGWRKIPPAVERQLYFLVSRRKAKTGGLKPCWHMTGCSKEKKSKCPAWEFQTGDLCWFINGTVCDGSVQADWEEKMKFCRSCKVFLSHLG
jgi:hypothetical protein